MRSQPGCSWNEVEEWPSRMGRRERIRVHDMFGEHDGGSIFHTLENMSTTVSNRLCAVSRMRWDLSDTIGEPYLFTAPAWAEEEEYLDLKCMGNERLEAATTLRYMMRQGRVSSALSRTIIESSGLESFATMATEGSKSMPEGMDETGCQSSPL